MFAIYQIVARAEPYSMEVCFYCIITSSTNGRHIWVCLVDSFIGPKCTCNSGLKSRQELVIVLKISGLFELERFIEVNSIVHAFTIAVLGGVFEFKGIVRVNNSKYHKM